MPGPATIALVPQYAMSRRNWARSAGVTCGAAMPCSTWMKVLAVGTGPGPAMNACPPAAGPMK